MLKILFLSVCYTVSFYSSTLLSDHFSPLFMIGFRGIISGLLLLGLHFSYEKKISANFIKYKKHYAYAIVFGFILPFILGATILNKLPAVDTAAIETAEPMITYILAAYFFRERLSKKQVLYLFLGSIFAFSAVIMEAQIERVALISWQELFVLAIAIIMAIGWLAINKLTHLQEPEEAIVGAGLICAGIAAAIMALYSETIKFSVDLIPVALFLLTIIFGDLIVTRMRTKLGKQYSATLISLVCIFVPFITALHQEIFKHEHYSYKFFLIMIPSIVCFIAFYHEELKIQTQRLS